MHIQGLIHVRQSFSASLQKKQILMVIYSPSHACTMSFMFGHPALEANNRVMNHLSSFIKYSEKDGRRHTHTQPLPHFPALLPSIWISCHSETHFVNMDAGVFLYVCVWRSLIFLTSISLLNHESTSGSPGTPPSHCLLPVLSWGFMSVAVFSFFWEQSVKAGVVSNLFIHACVCVCMRVLVRVSVAPGPLEFSLWLEWMANCSPNICLREWRGPTPSS